MSANDGGGAEDGNDVVGAANAPSKGRSWRVLLVVAAVVAFVSWVCWREARNTHQETVCKQRFRQIGEALHQYHDRYGSFPPAYVRGPNNERWHSWRVLLLPFLNEGELHAEYHFDEPWNGPRNSQLIARRPDVFACPAGDHVDEGATNYLAIVGRRSAWPEYLSLRIRDFQDGTTNTVLLAESADSSIKWTEPNDMTEKSFLKWHQATSAPSCCSRHSGTATRRVLLGGGSVRGIRNDVDPSMLGGLLTPTRGRVERRLPPNEVADNDGAGEIFPTRREATEFKQTDVAVTLAEPHVPGRNRLYCSTLQLAWDLLRRLPDNRVHTREQRPVVDALNLAPFPKGCLSEEDSLQRVVPISKIDELRAELERRFPNAQGPKTRPSNVPGFIVFAYLRKSFPFNARFDVLEKPMTFPRGGSHQVMAFGRLPQTDNPSDERLKQVRVISYRSDDDFVIELLSKNTRDRLILALVEPQESLHATVDSVLSRRPDARKPVLQDVDELAIPRFAFNLLKTFPEIEGLPLPDFDKEVSGGPAFISSANQCIAFVLNERGAELESFAELEVLGADESPPEPKPRQFIFDRPFLILMMERDAAAPYFALWVENADLMVTR